MWCFGLQHVQGSAAPSLADPHQAQADWNDERFFHGLVRRRRAALAEVQGVGLGVGVVHTLCGHAGRACLAVPALELRQVRVASSESWVGVGNGLGESRRR